MGEGRPFIPEAQTVRTFLDGSPNGLAGLPRTVDSTYPCVTTPAKFISRRRTSGPRGPSSRL